MLGLLSRGLRRPRAQAAALLVRQPLARSIGSVGFSSRSEDKKNPSPDKKSPSVAFPESSQQAYAKFEKAERAKDEAAMEAAARELLDTISTKQPAHYHHLCAGAIAAGANGLAKKLFGEGAEAMTTEALWRGTCNNMVKMLALEGDKAAADSVLSMMQKFGHSPDRQTFSAQAQLIVSSAAKRGRKDDALSTKAMASLLRTLADCDALAAATAEKNAAAEEGENARRTCWRGASSTGSDIVSKRTGGCRHNSAS